MSEIRWPSYSQGDVFSQRIREQWTERLGRRLDVLVAGCGGGTEIDMGRVAARLTGVDEDLPALRARTEARADLHAWSLGDLRSVPLPHRSFDVIRCEFLLERIRHTELVLDRLSSALRPGGLMFLRLRDRGSAYGFCSRVLPRRARRLLWPRFAPAGEVGPLPAVYEPIVSREGVQSYCLMRGLMIAEEYVGVSGPAHRGRFGPLVGGMCKLIEKASRGQLPAAHDEVTLVVRKPQNHFARII
ncbi:class I SAM-dependent methyltransferase [Rhizohabitans arisaemae]|uniref:class I SAM-dependent methyltransferase n=1 Tax=Rhizohabitans arisaemae TaxID=2720610 RepID=UPI0024B247E4|nr:methyltransferase domain-containing protein [Rhizohabitans arisaemae]